MIKLLLLLSFCISTLSFNFVNQNLENRFGKDLNAIPWPFTLCSDNVDWKIETLTLGQNPKRNINDDIGITGTSTKAVGFKRVELNVKLNGVFLDKEVIEFTESYDSGDHVEFNYKNFIPSFAPSGTYSLSFQFIDKNEKNNGCLAFTFKL